MTTININGNLTLDQTSGIQDNDFAITNDLTGLNSIFRTYLLALTGTQTLDANQLAYADAKEAAKSSATFVTVTNVGSNTTVGDLFFSDGAGAYLNGDAAMFNGSQLQTTSGQNIYLWTVDGGNVVLATTSNLSATDGEVVAAFYLNEAGDHLSAGIEMVTFMDIAHPDTTNPDDSIDWGSILNISAATTLNFTFDTLKSGKFLWVAVGDSSNGLLVTGKNLNVDANGDRVSGGSNPSDAMNTSQGGAGATIGVDSQMFVPGETAVFTLVTGLVALGSGPDATGENVSGIDYGGYINTTEAGIFISQKQGNTKLSMDVSVQRAGGGTTPEEGFAYIGTEPSGAFDDDTPIDVQTVTIRNNGVVVGTWALAPGAGQFANNSTHGGVTINIVGDLIHVLNIDALYTIEWTTNTQFNRFELTGTAGKFDVGGISLAQGQLVTHSVGDHLLTDDDGPGLSGAMLAIAVDEDELNNSQGVGNTDGDSVTYFKTFSYNDLKVVITGGDQPVAFALNFGVSGNVLKDDGSQLQSLGLNVVWKIDGSTIYGVTGLGTPGERQIFSLTQNTHGTSDPTDDDWTFTLIDQVDHPFASGDNTLLRVDLTPAFTAHDADGDAADLNGSSNLLVTVAVDIENDVPLIGDGSVTKYVDEDELNNSQGVGNTDGDLIGTSTVYTYADLAGLVVIGADEVVSFVLDSSLTIANLANLVAVKTSGGDNVYSKGDQLYWNYAGGVVQATTLTGRVAFTIDQTAGMGDSDVTNDEYTVQLYDQLDHLTGLGDNALLTIDITPGFVARDFDGDQVDLNGSANNKHPILLGVENDAPLITQQIAGAMVDFAVGAPGHAGPTSLHGAVGADDNNAVDQTAGGTKTYTIDDYAVLNNYLGLAGTYNSDHTQLTFSAGGNDYFRLTLGQSGEGSYTFETLRAPEAQRTNFKFTDLPSGQNLFGVIAGDKSQPDADALLVFGSDNHLDSSGAYVTSGANASDTINTSKGGGDVTIGNGNQMFDPTEGAWFIYTNDSDDASIAGIVGGLNQTSADDADTVGFKELLTGVRTASVDVVQTQAKVVNTMSIKAYDIDETNFDYDHSGRVGNIGQLGTDQEARDFVTNPLMHGGTLINITEARILQVNKDGSTSLLEKVDNNGTQNGTVITDAAGISVKFVESFAGSGVWSIEVAGLKANYRVEFDTSADHNATLTTNISGKYDIGGFSYFQGNDSPDLGFDFSVRITDYDGDIWGNQVNQTFDDFQIQVDGTGIYNDNTFII